jgi:hypothetical protein
MWSFGVKSGPAEIVSSGTVIGFSGHPIEIAFGTPKGKLTVVFKFEDDIEQPGPHLHGQSQGNTLLTLTLHNYLASLETGSAGPFEIGHFSGRRLLLSFRVHGLKDADPLLHFTLYSVESSNE